MQSNAKAQSNPRITAKTSWVPYLNLIFSVAFAVFVLGPPFLSYKFPPYPLMHVADVFDLLTPLVLLPLYWLLLRQNKNYSADSKSYLIFMVLIAFWVLGQGIHLAANSIDNLLNQEGIKAGDIYNLTYFYDETLGHYLWHFGVIGLSALLIYRQWHNPSLNIKSFTISNVLAGIIYGFVFFAMVVEGTTVPMGLPFSILVIGFILLWGRKKFKEQPLIWVFLEGYSLALLLFAIWGIWHQSFPGFFEVGIIK